MSTTALPRLFDLLSEQVPADSISRQDGLKLEWDDRWLLVRGSNTEPIVRFIAEAPSVELARGLCDQARRLASSLTDAT